MGNNPLFENLPSEWVITTLGEVCKQGGGDIQTGPFGSQLHASDYVTFGIPSIMPQNIGDNRINTDDIARITSEDANRLSRYLVKPGDIVYSRRGDVERRALIREKENGWLCGTGCLRIRFGSGSVDPLFASFYLGHPNVREWIVRHAVGATMPNLNTTILSSLPFVVPPLPEQRSIASILGALDDKIELNRKMNQTLETIARALFQSWFIDFDPVRANLTGQPLPGLDPQLAAIFPSSFQDSPLGEIPEGWEVLPLDQIANFLNGLALQKFPPEGDEYLPVIKIAELRKGITDTTDKASPNVDKRYIVADGDVLFSWSGSLEVCIWTDGPGALNQHLFKVTSEHYPKWFYYLWLKHYLPEFQHIAASKATTMGHIQRHHLSESYIVVPPANLLAKMTEVIEPFIQKFISNSLHSRTLATIRDALLPKLLSGQLRVPEAEQLVGMSL